MAATTRLWLVLAGVAYVAAGPLSTLRPYHVADDDMQKLREAVERDRAAAAAAEQQEPPPAAEVVPAAVPKVAGRSLVSALAWPLRGARLPVCLGAAAAAYTVQRRRALLRRLADEIEGELCGLQLSGSRRVEPPASASSRSMSERRTALTELRARKALLDDVLPMLAQLYEGKQEQALGGGKPLAERSSAELVELNTTLSARVQASGLVLAEYESLGQPPPPGFRTWPLSTLKERHANMTSRRDELRDVVRLLSQLGRQRMDWSLPELSADELREHAAGLAAQVAEAAERKERATLLGKIEAEMWRRKEETPIATTTLSTDELRGLLARLQGTPPPTTTAEEGA